MGALEDAQAETDAIGIMPMAVGPEPGISTPYVYWTVEDVDTGGLVEGAKFKFERGTRNAVNSSWNWSASSQGANPLDDCIGNCGTATSQLDRDPQGGEFQVNRYRTGTGSYGLEVSNLRNYRVSQEDPPDGYEWVVSGANTKTSGTTWNSQNGAQTHNFGTFQVRKLQTLPVCEAGYVYAISGSGQLQQVAPNGTVTTIGTNPGQTNMNGLGIGTEGDPVYALKRSSGSGTSQNGTVWVFNTTTGVWTDTGASTSALGNNYNTGTNLIGGAVDLSSNCQDLWMGVLCGLSIAS